MDNIFHVFYRATGTLMTVWENLKKLHSPELALNNHFLFFQMSTYVYDTRLRYYLPNITCSAPIYWADRSYTLDPCRDTGNVTCFLS